MLDFLDFPLKLRFADQQQRRVKQPYQQPSSRRAEQGIKTKTDPTLPYDKYKESLYAIVFKKYSLDDF
jgi:hypothetical protein